MRTGWLYQIAKQDILFHKILAVTSTLCISHAHDCRVIVIFLYINTPSNYLQFITRTIQFIPSPKLFQSIILQYSLVMGSKIQKCNIKMKLIVTLRLLCSDSQEMRPLKVAHTWKESIRTVLHSEDSFHQDDERLFIVLHHYRFCVYFLFYLIFFSNSQHFRFSYHSKLQK